MSDQESRCSASGFFVAMEGIDGAGTTTQSRLLVDRLKGSLGHYRVLRTCEPTTYPVGALIRNVLQGRLTGGNISGAAPGFDMRALALLFAADRLDHLASEIEPLLRAGWVVVSDRYLLSSLAYQTLDAPPDWIAAINRYARWPDLTVYLDVPPDVALARVRSGRPSVELFETRKRLGRVYAAYRRAIQAHENQGVFVVVDGTLPIDRVANEVWNAVRTVLSGRLQG